MFRKENGVTLVALVVTIIVLLILAGVTIAMVLGEDGIIARASETSSAQQKAALRDHVAMALATMRMEDVAYKADVGPDKGNDYAGRVETYLDKIDEATDAGADKYNATKATTTTLTAEVYTAQNKKETVTVTIIYNATSGNYTFEIN